MCAMTHPDEDEDGVEAGPLEDAGGHNAVPKPAAVDGEHERVLDDEDEGGEELRGCTLVCQAQNTDHETSCPTWLHGYEVISKPTRACVQTHIIRSRQRAGSMNC